MTLSVDEIASLRSNVLTALKQFIGSASAERLITYFCEIFEFFDAVPEGLGDLSEHERIEILLTINRILYIYLRTDFYSHCGPNNVRKILSGLVFLRVEMIATALNWEGRDEFLSALLEMANMTTEIVSSVTLLMEGHMLRKIAEYAEQGFNTIHAIPANCTHYWWTDTNQVKREAEIVDMIDQISNEYKLED